MNRLFEWLHHRLGPGRATAALALATIVAMMALLTLVDRLLGV